MAMRCALLLGILSTAGCQQALADGDGRAFGDDLGRFAVSATLDESDCGPGALDAPEVWEFDVILSRDEPVLYWNTGADAVEGELDADGVRFRFSSEVLVDLAEGTKQRTPCTVSRKDVAEGTLDDAVDTTAFSGVLEYHYAEVGEGECTEFLLELSITEMPCSMRYRMTGRRTASR